MPNEIISLVDQEQHIISLASQANADMWADKSCSEKSKEKLIQKFGNKENAMAETFFLLVRATKLALGFKF